MKNDRKVHVSSDINTGECCVFGTILEADTPNSNGLIFPREVLQKAVDEYNSREKGKYITFKNPEWKMNLKNVVAEVDKLFFDGKKVIIEAKVLDKKQFKLMSTKERAFNTVSHGNISDKDNVTVEEHTIDFVDIIEEKEE